MKRRARVAQMVKAPATLLEEARGQAAGLRSSRSVEAPSAPTRLGSTKTTRKAASADPAPVSEEVDRLAQSEGRIHVAPLVIPAGSAGEEKIVARAAASFSREVQRERARARREAGRERYLERKNTVYLPKSGEHRPAALRTYRPARAPSTQVTADVAAFAYPFLAEAGLGSRGILVGSDAWSGAAFVFDPFELYHQNLITNPNMLIMGKIGRGKALAIETPMLTTTGWSTMGCLSVGDEVYDDYGVPSGVIAVSEVMIGRPCYDVHFSDGSALVADAEHQWLTRTHEERCNGEPGKVRTTDELADSMIEPGGTWPNHAVQAADTLAVVRLERVYGVRPSARRFIVALEPRESIPVRCIEIANPLGVFLAGRSLVPTHNSALSKSLVTRSIAVGRRVAVACDPKGEWTNVALAVGGQAIVLGGDAGNRLNPLDAPPRPVGMDDTDWRSEVRRRRLDLLKALIETTLARSLYAVESTALDVALDNTTAITPEAEQPLLSGVLTELLAPTRPVLGSSLEQLTEDGRQVGHALRRLVDGDLKGLFDGPSTVGLDLSLPMVSIDMSNVSASDTAIALIATCASAWIESALADPNGGQRWIVYDEAWRLLKSPSLLARMQADWKLSRARGIVNVLVIHRLSDLDAVGDERSEARQLALGLLRDCSIKVIYSQEHAEALTLDRKLGLTDVEIAHLPSLNKGQGLWKVEERSFLVNHQMTPGELELFSTDQRMGS